MIFSEIISYIFIVECFSSYGYINFQRIEFHSLLRIDKMSLTKVELL